MKYLFLLLSITSLIFADTTDAIDPELGGHEEPSQEVAALDLNPESEVAAVNPVGIVQQPTAAEFAQLTAPTLPPPQKSPVLCTGLASLVPGLGHVYLGDMKTAGGLFGGTCLGMGAAVVALLKQQEELASVGIHSAQAVWYYGLYAAYRDVRAFNGASHYSYQMPTDQFSDLTLASFQFSVLKKPEVWGGLLGALGVGAAVAYFSYSDRAMIQPPRCSLKGKHLVPLTALPVGIGEECLFRGYLQSVLSENFSPSVGITVSSLVFGAAHIPNAQLFEKEQRWRYYAFSLPLITGIGAYLGWVTHKNHSLKESVALHAWYDFVIFAASAWVAESAIGPSSFSMAVPF